MKPTHLPSKLQRQIENTNRQIIKNYQHKHSALTKIQTILGIQHQITNPNNNTSYDQQQLSNNKQYTPQLTKFSTHSKSNSLIALNDQQILYYSCKYFVIFNLSTKEYQIINKDIKNCFLAQIKKFNTTENDKKLIVCIYQSQNTCENTFLGLLTIKTDYESRTSRNDSRYQWKVIRLHNQPINIEDYCFYSKKNLLYFVTSKSSILQTDNKISFCNSSSQTKDRFIDKELQFIWIYDLSKQIMLINQQIRSNTVGFFIQYLSLEDSNIIYLAGKNYFRQWTVNFNQKSVKQSNVRNVERILKNKNLVDFQQIDRYSLRQDFDNISQIPYLNPHLQHNNFHILQQPSKLLIILTEFQLILIKNNQLICSLAPEQNISKQARSKDNIQKELENSFNQIHKMKFLFDEYQELKQKQEMKSLTAKADGIKEKTQKQSGSTFTCISKSWKAQNQNYYFAIANSKYQVLIYELVDYQTKLYTQFCCSRDTLNASLTSIIPTQTGDLLLCVNQNNEVHLINQQNYDPQDDLPVKSLWGNGQMHAGEIFAISSPMIQNIMCTVGQDGSFKLWSMKKNQRSIMFEERPSSKPLGITIHPGGTMIGVNFERQIKLFSILPKQFYEITSIKTNYCSLQLRYSQRGEFLVSNQGSVLIFYEPFSLKTLGYIQPADLKCRIIDFKLSKNSNYICFIAEDYSCYLQPIDIGQLSKWQHFSPAHRQIEPYTAFYFDFIQKQKIVMDENKTRSLFVGATKNKYMILYKDLGSKLLAQFPIVDCYIVDIEVYQSLMFVATSKGTLRVYNWPILQQDLELQIVNLQQNQIRYKAPCFEQYQVWHESIPITKIHKLHFSNEIIVVNNRGNIGLVSFQQTKNKKMIYEQVSGERKKMQQLINQMFYIKKSEAQKRNKLIQKTQNDILKVQNEILRQKISLQRKMQQQQSVVCKGYEMKNVMQQSQKKQYIQKQQQQIGVLRQQIDIKKRKLSQLKNYIIVDYEQKKMYEQCRNDNVNKDIKQIVVEHKQNIKKKIQEHKQNIRNKKKQYFCKVKNIQSQFETSILSVYQNKIKSINLSQQSNNHINNTNNINISNNTNNNKIINNQFNNQQNNSQLKSNPKLLQKKSKSTQLLANILNQNTLSTQNVLQTNNPNVLKLLHTLQSIENHHYATQISNQHINNSMIKQSISTQNILTQNILKSTQNQQSSNKNISLTTTNNQKKDKLLKKYGQYMINQRFYINKKNKQQQLIKSKQLQLKISNKNKLMEQQFNNQILQQLTSQQNQDILIQACRVQQLQTNNVQLQKQINVLKKKVEQMQSQDEQLQKQFQKNLQDYNLARFSNLNLHCEVLKMQNQLIQRKQVLDNKQQIVMLAYQQKQKLQNYKQLVKGSLSKLQIKKQNMREIFFKKEYDLNSIFSELVNQINKMQNKKSTLITLQRKMKQSTKYLTQKQLQVNQVINKLKQIKKYLLLQRMNDQKSQKSIYQYQQSLITTINFLKKRLFMESIKQKKNKQLKKSALNQILKQNKNLLEQCNQLRSQGIQYQNQIKNLSNKLKQANKMISIQTKLKSQKNNVNQQKQQLDIIKQLFQMHLKQFQDNTNQKQSSYSKQKQNQNHSDNQYQQQQHKQNKQLYDIGKNVHFDSQINHKYHQLNNNHQYKSKPNKQLKRNTSKNNLNKHNNKVVFNNLTNAFTINDISSNDKDNAYTQYKPFKLSGYIQAQPFEKIQL